MKKRSVLAVLLAVAMVLSSFSMVFADAPAFGDMPDNWATAGLQAAVDNGLLKGYAEDGKTLIKPNQSLTRAEMATVVNRAFGAVGKADIAKAKDVASWQWFAPEIAKAVQMQTFALDTNMRPNDKITRQEAFVVLSRAFKMAVTDKDYSALDAFSDKASISTWALADLTGMKEAGYIEGAGGKLNPLANITRAEFATVMNKLVKQYINAAGDVTTVATGNIMVRNEGVVLKNLTIKGDLIIGDGVGEGEVTLDSVKVEGRTVIRGGGVNSIIIKGNSSVGKVIVSKVDGKVSVKVQNGADVDVVFVDDGSDDVEVQGNIGTLEVAADKITVTTTNATVASATISGTESNIIVGAGSTIKTGTISGSSSTMVVQTGATVNTLTVSGANAAVSGTGTVTTIAVTATAQNTQVSTPNTTVTVATGATGVTVGGESVPAGSTATTNATGTDATVTESTSTTTGGGGGGGSTPPPTLLYVATTDNPTGYSIDGLKAKSFNSTDLVSIINGLIDGHVFDRITSVAVTGAAEGIYAPLNGDAGAMDSNSEIDAILQSIANNAISQVKTVKVDNTSGTAVGITGFSYYDSTAAKTYTVKKVELSDIPNHAGTYVVWANTATRVGSPIQTASFSNIYDWLTDAASLSALAGVKITIYANDGTSDVTKEIVLHYDNL